MTYISIAVGSIHPNENGLSCRACRRGSRLAFLDLAPLYRCGRKKAESFIELMEITASGLVRTLAAVWSCGDPVWEHPFLDGNQLGKTCVPIQNNTKKERRL